DGFEAFSPATLDKLRADGRPVLVDFTAAWCITCLVNERVALSSDIVHQALKSHNVALLKGDWTNRDAEITRVLQAHGRSGVPLYLFYRPGQAEPDVWPQILTEAQVLEAVGNLPKQSASAQ
ncbi:thioredoxin family protein, partial [Nitrospirillum viridazoti]